jgi:hypothetical protein
VLVPVRVVLVVLQALLVPLVLAQVPLLAQVQLLLVQVLPPLVCLLVPWLLSALLLPVLLLLLLPTTRLPLTTKHLLGRKLPLPGSGGFFLPYFRISHAPDSDSPVFVMLALLCHGRALTHWPVWLDEYARWAGGGGWSVWAWV